MAEMGKYCKAYYAKDFRALDGWEENLENLRPDTKEEDGKDVEVARTELKDDDILYLQENFTVTDGIFKDEYIIFDKVTDLWKEKCAKDLEFEVPVYEPIEIKTAEEEGGEASAS
ncbi:MAG: hypothetical protein AAF560_05410 [Acidobacteriota bacterium]